MFGIIAVLFFSMSLIAFFAYAKDKRRAIKRRFRIPEWRLLSLGFFGGAAGACAAMLVLRHKTRHLYFWVVNLAGLFWQVWLLWWLSPSSF